MFTYFFLEKLCETIKFVWHTDVCSFIPSCNFPTELLYVLLYVMLHVQTLESFLHPLKPSSPPSAAVPAPRPPRKGLQFLLPLPAPVWQNPYCAVWDRRTCSAVSLLWLLWWTDVCSSILSSSFPTELMLRTIYICYRYFTVSAILVYFTNQIFNEVTLCYMFLFESLVLNWWPLKFFFVQFSLLWTFTWYFVMICFKTVFRILFYFAQHLAETYNLASPFSSQACIGKQGICSLTLPLPLVTLPLLWLLWTSWMPSPSSCLRSGLITSKLGWFSQSSSSA